MGTLNDRFQYVWYGTCDENENPCRELKFSDLPSESLAKIDSISMLGDSGMIKYDPSSSSSALDKFSCGKMYLVSLKPSAVASGGVEIANTLASSSMSRLQKYGISTTCNTTATPTPTPSPSPTPLLCIPDNYTTVQHSNDTQIVDGLGTVSFNDEGKFAVNLSDFSETQGLPRLLEVKTPDGFGVVDVTLQAWPASDVEPMIYFDCTSSFCNGKCYGGQMKPVTGTDNWEASLELIS